MRERKMFDIPLVLGTREELLFEAISLLGRGGCIATVNATMLEYARTHPTFADTLKEMTICLPDGQGIARAFRMRGEETETLPGVDLGLLLVRGQPNLRLALYGAKAGVAKEAADTIRSISPDTEIVYIRDGYHHTPFEVAKDLCSLSPDLCYVCLGSPKQERVARMLSRATPRTLVIPLGGSFDVWSGTLRRAPVKMQDMGLEWLYRMIKEPKRIKNIPSLISFSYHSFVENIQQNSQKQRKKAK